MDINKLINEPYGLIGIPFVSRGRNKDGMDCYGLLMELHRRMGIILPDYIYNSTDNRNLLHSLILEGKKITDEISRPEPLCIITISLIPGYTQHVGMMIDNVNFIHTVRKRNVCIERIDAPEWKKRIKGFFIWKEEFLEQCKRTGNY